MYLQNLDRIATIHDSIHNSVTGQIDSQFDSRFDNLDLNTNLRFVWLFENLKWRDLTLLLDEKSLY